MASLFPQPLCELNAASAALVCCIQEFILAQIGEPCLSAFTIRIDVMGHVRRPIAGNKA